MANVNLCTKRDRERGVGGERGRLGEREGGWGREREVGERDRQRELEKQSLAI